MTLELKLKSDVFFLFEDREGLTPPPTNQERAEFKPRFADFYYSIPDGYYRNWKEPNSERIQYWRQVINFNHEPNMLTLLYNDEVE